LYSTTTSGNTRAKKNAILVIITGNKGKKAMKGWMLIVTFFIFFTFFLTAYKWWHTPAYIKPLSHGFKMIGIIDMDANHGIDLNTVRKGKDIVLVLNEEEYKEEYIPTHPRESLFYARPFDLVNFDPGSGIIDENSSLWPYIDVVAYIENGANYQLLRPEDIGIQSFETHHITEHGDHTVHLKNGQTRILYETTKLK
jgi:hypothetical protein